MSDLNIEKALSSVQKSMEFEGFIIDHELMEKGREILQGKITSGELVDRYVHSIERTQHEQRI